MQKGDFVKIAYVGRLETGEIFDLTDAETAKKEGIYNSKIIYRDLPVVVGARFLIKGLDSALLGLNVGDKKTVEVKPDDGFGQRDAKLVRTVPRKFFKDQKVEPRQGMIVDFGGMKGRIQSVDAGRIRVDFNNPMAGHTLKYDIEVKQNIEEPLEQVKALLEFFGADKVDAKIEGNTAIINIRLPSQLKGQLSSLIIEHVKGIENVNFVESYGKDSVKAHDHEGHDHSHE